MLTLLVTALLLNPLTIQLETSAFANEYTNLRTWSQEQAQFADAHARQAIEAMRQLDEGLPGRINLPSKGELQAIDKDDRSVRDLYWSVIDSIVLGCKDLEALKSRVEMLPEKIGGYLSVRESVQKIIGAIESLEKLEQSKKTSGDKAASESAIRWWDEVVRAKCPQIYDWISNQLGIEGPPSRIRVIVVPRYPGKGAITLRTTAGPLIIVSCEKFVKDDFAEAVIHESIHALEAASQKVEVLHELRENLKTRKIESFATDQLPHTLFFLIAAEATRRFVEPYHIDVGEKFGAYKRGLEPFRAYAGPILKDLYEKKIDRAVAVAKLSQYNR